MEGQQKLGVVQGLYGRLDEYAMRPEDVIVAVLAKSIREYAELGGDLEDMRISVTRSHDGGPGTKVEVLVSGWTT